MTFRDCVLLHSHKKRLPSRPDLSALDFWILSLLEKKNFASNPQSFEALKVKLQKEWANVPQKVVPETCMAFPKRVQLDSLVDSGHINQ